MIKFFISICLISTYIISQKKNKFKINKNIIFFYANFFSRCTFLDLDLFNTVRKFGIVEKKIHMKKFFSLQYNKMRENTKKNLNWFTVIIKNFCKIFFTLIYPKLTHYKNCINLTKSAILSIERPIDKFYSIKNNVISISNSYKNYLSYKKKNSKKIFDVKGLVKNEQHILNFPIFITKLNIILNTYNIKGFTRSAFEVLANLLDTQSKEIILKMGKITVQKQKFAYSRLEQWGRKNSFYATKKPCLLTLKVEKTINYQKSLQKQIACFRKLKKSLQYKKKKINIDTKPAEYESNINKKKIQNNSYSENLKKTNKTLMSLLNGILQRRIRILKEATKCLNKYKPFVSKLIYEKVNPVISEKRKFKENFLNKNNPLIRFKEEMWCTSKDCLNMLHFDDAFQDKTEFFKWYLYLCNDYNSQQNYERMINH
jgi:hypothetical protein